MIARKPINFSPSNSNAQIVAKKVHAKISAQKINRTRSIKQDKKTKIIVLLILFESLFFIPAVNF
jgi:hypothetical protein